MKKVLFGSTALVAAAFAGSAFANGFEEAGAPITMSVGGYMQTGVGIGPYQDFALGAGTTVDKDVHIIQNGEIHFNAAGTLDNGLSIQVRVELEQYGQAGATNNAILDEEYVNISSSWGRLLIGQNDTAVSSMAGYIGSLGSGVGGGSYDYEYKFTPGYMGVHTGDMGDDASLQYFTPNIAGFQIGVSWAPGSGNGDSSGSTADTELDPTNSNDVMSIGATYSNSFGDVSFLIGGGFATRDFDTIAGSDLQLTQEHYGGGAEIGFSGFTVGGRVDFFSTEEGTAVLGVTGEDETFQWGAGITYATGPWTFGVNAAGADFDENGADDGTATGSDYEILNVNFGVAYDLGDGVAVGVHADYGDFDSTVNANDADSWSGAVVLGISF